MLLYAGNSVRACMKNQNLSLQVPNEELHPSPYTKVAFLKYFEDEKDVDGADKFCEILKRLGCLSCNEYYLLLKTYIVAGKSDLEMRQGWDIE
ncbi:pentatricopeptide repeat-containing protein [Pyrus ussuriensis x Pyrus communis]|uniref:Pentatricopeptide repeat-containing protein n=1 Tax=Pyrus ussuriensis x Pyrus communis TaxID=2448454 RepID=A0A5N5FC72_9ROSA|nr:pentatricopeptide repeat-containing protein [Pyrus ussuriensis x Pyrus communis]KAB2603720.1 pentatricopeptide repeat-containing protein [Pyrus ussuriensis x Pyrus communis]